MYHRTCPRPEIESAPFTGEPAGHLIHQRHDKGAVTGVVDVVVVLKVPSSFLFRRGMAGGIHQ